MHLILQMEVKIIRDMKLNYEMVELEIIFRKPFTNHDELLSILSRVTVNYFSCAKVHNAISYKILKY